MVQPWFVRERDSRGHAIDSTVKSFRKRPISSPCAFPKDGKTTFTLRPRHLDWMHENVPYDDEALTTPRSGPTCLADGLKLRRTNQRVFVHPEDQRHTWLVCFRRLVDPLRSSPHGNAHGATSCSLLTKSGAPPTHRGQRLFVEASVDVVNNKWLLHTTNAYVDWMEEAIQLGTPSLPPTRAPSLRSPTSVKRPLSERCSSAPLKGLNSRVGPTASTNSLKT